MTLSFLQQRVMRVLTRPPEIAYALTRHATLLAVFALLGTGVVWILVVAQPPIYEGRAQLLISKNDPMLDSLSETVRRGWREPEQESFVNAQGAVLRSESVVRKLILCTGFSWGAAAAESEEPETFLDRIAAMKAAVKKGLSDLLLLETPAQGGPDQEVQMRRSIEAFQKRSEVVPEKQNGTIDLLVRGEDGERLKLELRCWIEAYKNHLTAMARDTWDGFLLELGANYARRKETASAALEEFRATNPGVAESKVDFLSEAIRETYLQIAELRRRELELSTPVSTRTLGIDPAYQALVTAKTTLEQEKAQKIASGFKPDSGTVQKVQKQLDYVSEQLAAYTNGPLFAYPEEQVQTANLAAILQERVANRTAELQRLTTERNQVSDKLNRLDELQKRYEAASETLDHFELVRLQSLHTQSPLNVQVSDEPNVDTTPVGLSPLTKIGLGSMAGLFIGVLCALVLEIFCSRVRFKRDLIDDFGLPVVAVLPR